MARSIPPSSSFPAQGPLSPGGAGGNNQEQMRPSALLRAPGRGATYPAQPRIARRCGASTARDLGEPGRVRRPRGRGAAEAKKPSGAWANNCPKPGGALQGLRTRGVTFQGRWQLRPAQLRVQKNRRSWGEELQALRLPLGCLKGRLPTSGSAYW